MPTPSTTLRPVVRAARMRLLVAALTALAIVPASTPAAAVEAQGIRLDPAAPSSLGAGEMLRPAIPPGGAASYDLTLRNQRDVPVEVLVYGADVTAEGEVASGVGNAAVGAWITVAEPRVALEPGADATVAVTIMRPGDDSDGGTGAVVAQLSDRSRQEFGLDVLRRAAIRVEVAADGSGQGVHVAVTDQDPSRGFVPGVLAVEVTITNPGDEEAAFDGTLHILRRLGGDSSREMARGTLAPGEQVVRRIEVELPWYGVIGRLRAEAATVAVTSSSRPARLVVVPTWALLPLLVAAGWAAARVRRSDQPLLLGRLPATDDESSGAGEELDDATADAAVDHNGGDADDDNGGDGDDANGEDANGDLSSS